MITETFAAFGGTVIGTAHRQAGRNNQDSFAIANDGANLAAVVCDGCSSSPASEVGARLISRLAAQETLELMARAQTCFASDILEPLRLTLLDRLRQVAKALAEPASAVDEMFLATIVGAVVNEYACTIFSLGDGVISINGQPEIIDERNLPSYLGYSLYPEDYPDVDQKKIRFVRRAEIPTGSVYSILVASDGLAELETKKDLTMSILGKAEPVRGIDQFELDDRYLKNPSLLTKRLFQLNSDRSVVDWQNRRIIRPAGLLTDDTTLVLIRRR